MNILRLWKGRNNGITLGTLTEIDEDGVESAFDLTGAAVTLQIYQQTGKVVASITGSVVSAADGQYKALPDNNDLDALTAGETDYYWCLKIVNATYPQGRIFAEDENGRLQPVIIMGNESGI